MIRPPPHRQNHARHLQSLNVRDLEQEVNGVVASIGRSAWLCLLPNPLPHHVLPFLREREGSREREEKENDRMCI